MTSIRGQKTVYQGKLVVEKAQLRDKQDNEFDRERIKRPDAAAVLLYNTDSGKVIVTRQYRYAIADKAGEEILEIVAGKLDGNEEAKAAVIREAEEEAGYRIKPEHLQLLVSCFASPGYSSECFHLFFARVDNQDKVSDGGGLAEENEHIELVEIKREQFRDYITNGQIRDAKTYVAALMAMYRELI